jgi:prepilin signal peptidase PulO-like enzyme (type II secretory pathway)
MISAGILSLFTALSLYLAWTDWKTTYVSYLGLMALTGIALVFAFLHPLSYTPVIEHLFGGALGAFTGLSLRFFLGRVTEREAFGEADVWILTAGGLLIGLQWVALWFGGAAILGIVLFGLMSRTDTQENDTSKSIIPFLPLLIFTLLPLIWLRYFDILAPRIL